MKPSSTDQISQDPLLTLSMGKKNMKLKKSSNHKRFGRGRKVQYLVKWKGYPESENQWVDWDNLHADEVIADFKKKNPEAVSHIKAEGSEADLNNSQPSMTTDDYSSAPLTTILGADMPPEV